MDQRFKAGDFLFFQLESGFALSRLLVVEGSGEETVWHLMAYHDLFPDVETIEQAVTKPETLTIALPHVALTNRAFDSTQVAEIGNLPPVEDELERVMSWQNDPERVVSDYSIRLLTGLR